MSTTTRSNVGRSRKFGRVAAAVFAPKERDDFDPTPVLDKDRERYYFSLKSTLRPVGYGESFGFEIPEGIRLHVQYDSAESSVSTDPGKYQKGWSAELPNDDSMAKTLMAGGLEWFGIKTGRILSGGDWILIQKNGVAKFDARVTIRTNDDVLIDGVFIGNVDLRRALRETSFRGEDLGAEVYRRYLDSGPDCLQFPITLGARFEAAGQPHLRPGEDASWINNSRYAKQRKNFWKYQKLVRGLFMARGSLTVGDKPRWPPQSVSLDVYEML